MSDALPAEWQLWLQEGARLLAVPPLPRSESAARGPEDPKFALGDFLLTVPEQYIDALAEQLQQKPARFRVCRDVAQKFPPQRRVAAAWSTHRDCRKKPHKLRPGMRWSRTTDNLTVDEKVEKVREFLADRDVYRRIEQWIATSKDRRMRGRARVIHAETDKLRKEAEADLREMQNAKSPFEAAVKAQLELLDAAQYAYAVGELFGDLPESERVIDALRRLQEAVAVALHKALPEPPEPPAEVIDGEAWQARSARAAIN
jgi:hypothetical protein